MRDTIYLISFLLGVGLLLYVGQGLLLESMIVTWGLTFAGTTAAAVLGMALYRVQHQLRASRYELARKQAEIQVAQEVQQALFPRQFPADCGLEFSGVCIPARDISGDYYDVMQLSDGHLFFAIADISGKGISAAILMSNVHAVSRTLAKAGCSPAQIGSQLNRHLFEMSDSSRFATYFYAEWDPGQRCLSYLNAGHNPPLLLGSLPARRLDAITPPLGILPDLKFQEKSIPLGPRDLIVLYSDGLTDAGIGGGQDFGEAQLVELVTAHKEKPLAEIQEEVLKAVYRWGGGSLEDDMTLLLVRATESGQKGGRKHGKE